MVGRFEKPNEASDNLSRGFNTCMSHAIWLEDAPTDHRSGDFVFAIDKEEGSFGLHQDDTFDLHHGPTILLMHFHNGDISYLHIDQ